MEFLVVLVRGRVEPAEAGDILEFLRPSRRMKFP